jgi:hypothetical protein
MTESRLQQGDESWLQGDGVETASAAREVAPGAFAWPLLLAVGGLLIGVVTLRGGIGMQILGYLSASVLLFTAVAWFRRGSYERTLKHGVSTSPSLNVVALLLLVAGFALALIHAWNIAIHFS